MDWRDRLPLPGRLRLRFVIAAGLLVLTTVTASIWTLVALTRLSGIVTDTVQQSESVTAVTSRLSGALEREDDAVLLILAGNSRGGQVLGEERAVVDRALRDLFRVLGPTDRRDLASPLDGEVQAYRRASDGVIAIASQRDALVEYHQLANPVLRRAVSQTTTIRDRHFELAREAVASAGNEAAAARRVVLSITVIALGIAVAVAWHLTRTVVGPVRRLTEGARAIRRGDFSQRIDAQSHDELGDLASAFNDMAGDLAEFRRTNISEVVRAKNTLEATLEALPDAVILFDAAGHIQSMNRAAVNALSSVGIQAPASLEDLRMPGLDLNALRRGFTAGADPPAAIDLSLAIHVEQDGSARRLLPRVVPVGGTSTSRREGAILLLYDVTDLARLDEMRSELVAVASHELQTPLTTMRMALLMLHEGYDELPERQRQLVATSLIGVEQLTEIVHEFLDLTRIEAGELRLNLERILPATVVAEAVNRLQNQATAQGIALHNRVASDLPFIVADPVRLRVVFDNVLSNALKYTPGGGRVEIDSRYPPGAADSGQRVSISVTDTGPGIPEAFQVRIFDKFFRLEHDDAARGPGSRGAGIGLYMCRQIVELHGGSIACGTSSTGGTCITVTLPTQTIDTSAACEPATYVSH